MRMYISVWFVCYNMVEVRIKFDDDEQYERLKKLKKHRGLTWKGLLLEGEKKVKEYTPE